MIEIKVPTVGESISEVTLVKWTIANGDYVKRDQVICELESEKATFELNAEQAGTVTFVANEGDDLKIGDLVCKIDETAAAPAEAAPSLNEKLQAAKEEQQKTIEKTETKVENTVKATPVAAQILADKNVKTENINGSGPAGKITKSDVLFALNNSKTNSVSSRNSEAKKMSNLRKTVSRRLVEAKNTTAMLTTFNEVDMTAIMDLRKVYKEKFVEKHGVGLGFMSFFIKACCMALEEWPSVNSYIDGENIISHNYCDISIAVSAPKGLVVPIIRNAESLNLAGLELAVKDLATKAKENKLTMEEMTGGTFTLTNGGVFGSLLSTPIINIPQSAILGMHKIQDRPMVENGQIVIKPMMYLALSYDHRIIDGRESVGFLVRVKELLENPTKMIVGKSPNEVLLDF
ncbi:MAG: 2-oxoglutarate dehydrogenase complex dihydrolipoyllysine-residue succinyltransferase [Chitinophagaceae bacterium]|nr:2-oxoglutarate dehydrogenase complex dihydrolipoyllysine-residue succinyltransferase [Chitinophagaceae bacterium]